MVTLNDSPLSNADTTLTYDWNMKRIELLNIACHTPKIKNLQIEKLDGSLLTLRPTIHQYYSVDFGGLKTTLFKLVKKAYGGFYCADATSAGIQGSIDQKTREYVPPIAYLCKGKTLIIDEFNLNPNTAAETVKSLLSLLEDEVVSRKMGIVGKKPIETEDVYCKHGWMQYKNLRCNVILGTMKNIRKARRQFYSALVSRTVPIRITQTIEVLKSFDDYPQTLFHKINYDVPEEIRVSNKEYLFIRSVVEGYKIVSPQQFFRTINDCVRVYAVLGKHDLDLYDFIVRARNWK